MEIILTLPHEITLAGPVRVRCLGRVHRTEGDGAGASGVVAEIQRYEFLRARRKRGVTRLSALSGGGQGRRGVPTLSGMPRVY